MSVGIRFPFEFDARALRAELGLIRENEWSPHFNERDYGGKWRGAALRSATGLTNDLNAARNLSFQDTALVERLPEFRKVLDHFRCPLKSVRLLSLAPGSFIREHCDNALEYSDGEIRIHVPVLTNPVVEFYVCGERLQLNEGGCYYLNVNLPHRVNNRGNADRIHLVIDAQVNEWVDQIFREHARPIERCPLPPLGLVEFQRHVLANETLQSSLRELTDRREFLQHAVHLALEDGFELMESDLDAGFRSPAIHMPNVPPGWTPVSAGSAEAELVWTGTRAFTEPFFEDTIRKCLRNPFAQLFRRRVSIPETDLPPHLEPTGFIFHMSRCGSTLIGQMLAAVGTNIVISEAPPIDDVIQRSEPAAAIRNLRWMLRALGQRRNGLETNFFVKFDAWHVHRLPLIRAAFPETPWIFVQRDPAEILKSWRRVPGRQSVPGLVDPAALGLPPSAVAELTREEWCEQVLAGFVAASERCRDEPRGLFVDYAELPRAVTGRIAEHFKLPLSAAESVRMLAAARFNAKNPTELFAAHSAG